MTKDCYLINTSRCEIVDEKALLYSLKIIKLQDGLDVFRRKRKWQLRATWAPNAILMPHLGSATVEGRIEMGEKVIVNIKTFIDGHNPLINYINSLTILCYLLLDIKA